MVLRKWWLLAVLSVLLGGCEAKEAPSPILVAPQALPPGASGDADKRAAPIKLEAKVKRLSSKIKFADVSAPAKPLPAIKFVEAAPESPRGKADTKSLVELSKKIATHYTTNPGATVYIQSDKPLYKPGETIWVNAWNLNTSDLSGHKSEGVFLELISPRGNVVQKYKVHQKEGRAAHGFELAKEAPGGEYRLRVRTFASHYGAEIQTFDRPIFVSVYQAPRIKKKLDFQKKAYGPGDLVSADITIKRPTGEAMAGKTLRVQVRVDGVSMPESVFTTDDEGKGVAQVTLPKEITVGDVMMTVLIDDGGVTESITRRVPVTLKKLNVALYPEGGDLVVGLPSRVYFEASKPTTGKPADVSGEVLDDTGKVVAKFESYRDGLGRFDLTPEAGRKYHIKISKPVGITTEVELPLAKNKGCTLKSIDDLDSQTPALRVAIRCTEAQAVNVVATLREKLVDGAMINVPKDKEALLYLKSADEKLVRAPGAVRVTLFDSKNNPMAERLVFRNRRERLQVSVKPDATRYQPRDKVTLKIQTLNAAGEPVAANLALSITDDTVLSYADDKSGHILSKLLMEPELSGKIEEPNFYLDLSEDKSALALDLLMGTRGWRRFDWTPVFNPPSTIVTEGVGGPPEDPNSMPKLLEVNNFAIPVGGVPAPPAAAALGALQKPGNAPQGNAPQGNAPQAAPRPAPKPVPAVVVAIPMPPAKKIAGAPAFKTMMKDREQKGRMAGKRARRGPRSSRLDAGSLGDIGFGAAEKMMEEKADLIGHDRGGFRLQQSPEHLRVAWVPARVFPEVKYSERVPNTRRTDFRETIHWAPAVTTDTKGEATVSFYLSDAITSFRVTTEGVSNGTSGLALPGRDETVLTSSRLFSMNVKLPVEVSAGDMVLMPLTLTNETDSAVPVKLTADFGPYLKAADTALPESLELAAASRETIYFPLNVQRAEGDSKISFDAVAGERSDAFDQSMRVALVGFPIEKSFGGLLTPDNTHTFDMTQALEGSMSATLTIEPGPIASVTQALEGMIREPGGCFEQTSSSNYPNALIIDFLDAQGKSNPKVKEKAGGMLKRGYKRLIGFETSTDGFEWFGKAPGHLALTAYGLLEFTDMQSAYNNIDPKMLQRTQAFLVKHRDGKGGFKNPQSRTLHTWDSGPVIDAYVVYSLTEAGVTTGFDLEIAEQVKKAQTSKDPYILALAASTLFNLPQHKGAAQAAVKRLAAMQQKSGVWDQAKSSATASRGMNLHIETTALALSALIEDGQHPNAVSKGMRYLYSQRSGGRFGSTQATILTLKTLLQYTQSKSADNTEGAEIAELLVNGKVVKSIAIPKDPTKAIKVDLSDHLTRANIEISLRYKGKQEIPYTIQGNWRQIQPANHAEAPVSITTSLDRDAVSMGESVRLTAKIKNLTSEPVPMTMARIGIPGGLNPQIWQLKELKEKGLVAFYETRPREVIVYLSSMKAGEEIEIPLELSADIPGRFTSPASRSYLYYTDDMKHWAPPVTIAVSPSQ